MEPMNVMFQNQNGTFVESLQYLGAGFMQSLNTSIMPDANDTFYAKSIMTPMNNEVVDERAWESFVSYLANEGNETSLVSYRQSYT